MVALQACTTPSEAAELIRELYPISTFVMGQPGEFTWIPESAVKLIGSDTTVDLGDIVGTAVKLTDPDTTVDLVRRALLKLFSTHPLARVH